jgi:hypothetical protein
MYTLQIETATKLINTTDATIIGILLFIIVLLVTAIGFLWNQKQKDEKYIREQDKANLEMLLLITNSIKDVGKSSDSSLIKLDAINTRTSTILELIKERLK